MRRTPACVVYEEESHLKKMLDAGVIQKLILAWDSALVFIRKCEEFVHGAWITEP